MSYYKGLLKTIRSSTGERAVLNYLKLHPRPIIAAFCKGWHFHYCIPEFRFADDYRADFLVLGGHSGGFMASFVELESTTARLYLKDRTPSKALRIALRQIDDWRTWVSENDSLLRKSIKKMLPTASSSSSYELKPETIKGISAQLSEPDMFIHDYYYVVIGRRQTMTPEERLQRNRHAALNIESQIVSYDRLLDVAKLQDIYGAEVHRA